MGWQDRGTEESEVTVTGDMAQGKELGRRNGVDLLEGGLRSAMFSSVGGL